MAADELERRLADALSENERLRAVDADRQRKADKLQALLPEIASTLDVRTIFGRLGPLIREVLPFDLLSFALLTPDGGGVRVQANLGFGEATEWPEYRFSSDVERVNMNWQYLLAYDIEVLSLSEGVVRVRLSPPEAAEPVDVELRPPLRWVQLTADHQMRSMVRVPLRDQEKPIGGFTFVSKTPATYRADDVALAARIADHFSLALAHERLADEARQAAQARERAAQLEVRVGALSRELERFTAHRALGRSAKWRQVLTDATRVAATDTTVLITGESGTGKEVVARFIHRASKRSGGPFVALNCAALPEQLLESELFGYERGAFTGAHASHAGKIEQAAGGVLFLDEVGEMSPTVQAKFLRVLQERELQRLGSARTVKADVRVLAATNRDPRQAMEKGLLREDLYYRLSVFEIRLPALRERPEDIEVLVEAFLDEIARGVGRPAAGLSEEARDQLLAHHWPGNVRELRNAIERAVILCDGGLVTREHLPITVVARPGAGAAGAVEAFPAEGVKLDAVERDLLEKAMAGARNNKSRAAKLLGVSRGQLYSLLRRHGLTDARR